MAKKKEQKKGLTVQEYAAHRAALGLPGAQRQAVYKALRAGRIKRNKDGLIDAAKADAAWKSNTLPRERGRGSKPTKPTTPAKSKSVLPKKQLPNPDGDDQDEEQVQLDFENPETKAAASTQKTMWQARLAKLDFEMKSGKILDREQTEQALFTLFRELRDSLLKIHLRMADHLDDQGQRRLEKEIRDALEQTSHDIGSALSA